VLSAGTRLRQRIIRGAGAGSALSQGLGALRKKPKALPPWAESTNEKVEETIGSIRSPQSLTAQHARSTENQ